MPHQDPEKRKAYRKAQYEKNKELEKAQVSARREANRKYINEIKGNPCVRCGGIFTPSAMDFHHIDPNTKANKDNKSNGAINPSWTIEKIKAEVEKCILVCANCHRIIHASVEEVLEFEIRQTTETQRDSCGVRRI